MKKENKKEKKKKEKVKNFVEWSAVRPKAFKEKPRVFSNLLVYFLSYSLVKILLTCDWLFSASQICVQWDTVVQMLTCQVKNVFSTT